MNEVLLSAAGCFLLGIMTTLHPCPLATNVAAISMLTGWSKKSRKALWVFVSFIAGYLISYLSLSIIIATGVLTVPILNDLLHTIFFIFLGPLLILVGMLIADLLNLNRFYEGSILRWIEKRQWSGLYALPMGALIAPSFCPATAAIFFGILIPMAIRLHQTLLFPALYAAGAAMPLIGISFLLYRGSSWIPSKKWQKRVPRIMGWIMIVIGVYLTIEQIYL
jgi:cytochrome c biogenesis protein CcdA